jgi:pimeloyl-ACP methyl ester carboxylesterase
VNDARVAALTLGRGALRFSARSCGQGPLVLCLHGFPDNAGSWRHQLPVLADAGFRAVAVTLRGYEPSSVPPAGGYDQADLAADVIGFLDGLGAVRAHLVGHDWGAAIGYAAAAAAPARFASLTTLAVPHPGRFLTGIQGHPRQLRLSWYMFFFQLRGIAERRVSRNDFEFIRRLWRHWSPGWEVPQDVVESAVETLRQPGVLGAALGYYRAALRPGSLPLTRSARRAACFQVPVPTLAITGERDGCIDSRVFRDMMRPGDFPAGLEVATIPDAGHFVHQEQPVAVNSRLLDWLGRHPCASVTR